MTDPIARPTEDGGVVVGDNYHPERYADADGDGQPDGREDARTVLQLIPTPVRLALYTMYALGGPVLIYLQACGLVGPDELALWAGIGTVLGITAAGNVTR